MITDSSVFSDTVTINAPVSLVWEILIDFKNYEKWNPFCPSIINTALDIGEAVEMQIDLGNGLQKQIEILEIIDAPQTIAWGMIMESADKLKALRTQSLKAIDENHCEYNSEDAFSGELTAMIIEHMGTAIETGFNQCAYGLKAYAETKFAETTKD